MEGFGLAGSTNVPRNWLKVKPLGPVWGTNTDTSVDGLGDLVGSTSHWSSLFRAAVDC